MSSEPYDIRSHNKTLDEASEPPSPLSIHKPHRQEQSSQDSLYADGIGGEYPLHDQKPSYQIYADEPSDNLLVRNAGAVGVGRTGTYQDLGQFQVQNSLPSNVAD